MAVWLQSANGGVVRKRSVQHVTGDVQRTELMDRV